MLIDFGTVSSVKHTQSNYSNTASVIYSFASSRRIQYAKKARKWGAWSSISLNFIASRARREASRVLTLRYAFLVVSNDILFRHFIKFQFNTFQFNMDIAIPWNFISFRNLKIPVVFTMEFEVLKLSKKVKIYCSV